jgi:hypothetical protein
LLRANPSQRRTCDIYDGWWLRTNLRRLSACAHTQGTRVGCLAGVMLHGIVWSPAGYFIESMTPILVCECIDTYNSKGLR